MTLHRLFALFIALLILPLTANFAAASPSGRCLAVAQNAPDSLQGLVKYAALKEDEVQVTFVGHSTFRITTAAGISIVTDYAGLAGDGRHRMWPR